MNCTLFWMLGKTTLGPRVVLASFEFRAKLSINGMAIGSDENGVGTKLGKVSVSGLVSGIVAFPANCPSFVM